MTVVPHTNARIAVQRFVPALLMALPGVLISCQGRDQGRGSATSDGKDAARAIIVDALPREVGPAALPPEAAVSPPVRTGLTIFYTNDLLGRLEPDATTGNGGLARRATILDRARMDGDTIVQVDAGDFLPALTDEQSAGAAPLSLDDRSHVVLSSYRRMGVDVVTLGERELALGPTHLAAALKAADLKVVAANVVDARTKRHPFPASELVTAGDIRVGVMGILDLPAERADEVRRHGFRIEDAAEVGRKTAEALRTSGAQLVVGLFHVGGGLPRVQEILTQAIGIDVVIMSRTAEAAEPHVSTRVGRTLVVSAAAAGAELGRLAVSGVRAGSDPVLEDRALPLGKDVPDHMGVRLVEQAALERVRAESERKAAALLRNRKEKEKKPRVYENWTYGSNGACASCHLKQAQQWSGTDHAHAFATLEGAKHSRDPECLGCHTVAYLQPGGTRSMETLTGYFLNVGCEACHGPSALHVRSANKKIGTSRKVSEAVCFGCHTPDQNIGPFDYVAALKAVLGPGHGAPPAQLSK